MKNNTEVKESVRTETGTEAEMQKDLQIVTDSEGDSEDYVTEEETGKPEEKKKPKNKKN